MTNHVNAAAGIWGVHVPVDMPSTPSTLCTEADRAHSNALECLALAGEISTRLLGPTAVSPGSPSNAKEQTSSLRVRVGDVASLTNETADRLRSILNAL